MSSSRSPAIPPVVMPFVLALAYAEAIFVLAGDPLADWFALAWLKGNGFFSAIAVLAPVMLFGKMILNRRTCTVQTITQIVSEFYETRIRPGYGLPFLTPVLTAILVGTAYNVFKQRMLPTSGFGYDATFAAIDRGIFGTDPWHLTHALASSPSATRIIDAIYHPFFFPMTMGIALCTFLPLQSRARLRHTLAFALLMIGSTGLAWMLPAVGPCFDAVFHHNPQFAGLTQTLADQQSAIMAQGHQSFTSLTNQAKLLRLFGSHSIADGGGIAALPSLHNALSTLFICFALSFNRRLAWVALPYGAIILFGSVHLGWHYAIDGVVGIAFAITAWLLTGPLARSAGLKRSDVARRRGTPAIA